ncbi:MAG: hypothetical protein KJO91_03845, partial [Gammaproteobacteria bacterium]|nr:hypothetical protein [Gammaproteobacteria bacterium]
MAEIAGYKVYYGPSQGNYTNHVSISGGDTMQVTLSSLAKGTYHLVVTTLDVYGRESAHSQAVFGSV